MNFLLMNMKYIVNIGLYQFEVCEAYFWDDFLNFLSFFLKIFCSIKSIIYKIFKKKFSFYLGEVMHLKRSYTSCQYFVSQCNQLTNITFSDILICFVEIAYVGDGDFVSLTYSNFNDNEIIIKCNISFKKNW